MPKELTAQQVAQAIGRPLRTVQRWIALGWIRGRKLGPGTFPYVVAASELGRARKLVKSRGRKKH